MRQRGIFHKYVFDAPHRKRLAKPGSQIELRCPPLGAGRDIVILKDTYQCQHWPCTRIIKLPHGVRIEDVGGYCKHCNGLICDACIRLSKCLPMEEGLYRHEEMAKIQERMGAEVMIRDMGMK